MKFLLVDDSKTMRNIQKRILTGIGPVEFAEAGDGVQALEVLRGVPEGFQLILIDWNMPNMDGITLVNRIRATDKKTPLVMVTTESEKSRIMDAIKAGVNNYVLKPFTPETMLEKIKQTLKIAA
jgi:two-component system chemotaxis response regulator CheY